jgi:hypothetical protein
MVDKCMGPRIARAAQILHEADGIIVAAGAGMGVDSGLPDFRGNEGFWKAYPALAGAGIDFQMAASAGSFVRDPARAWGFYGHRLALYRRTVAHAGFGLIQKWSQAKPHGCSVFTSNVDGQFQLAGFDPFQVQRVSRLDSSSAVQQAVLRGDLACWRVFSAGGRSGLPLARRCPVMRTLRGSGAAEYPDVRRLGLGRASHAGAARVPAALAGAGATPCRHRDRRRHGNSDRASFRYEGNPPAQRELGAHQFARTWRRGRAGRWARTCGACCSASD